MQQPPNLNPQYPQQQDQQPLQRQPRKQQPKKNLRKLLWLLVSIVFVIAFIMGLASRGQNQQSATTTTQPTAVPTPKPIVPTRSQIDALLISNEPDVTIASYNQQSATLVLQESFTHTVPITQNETKQNLQDIQPTPSSAKVSRSKIMFLLVMVSCLSMTPTQERRLRGRRLRDRPRPAVGAPPQV